MSIEVMPCEGQTLKSDWRLVYNQTKNMSNSAASVITILGPPYWVATLDFQFSNLEDYRRLESFINRREGSRNSFLMHRFLLPGKPHNPATSLAVNPADSQITLGGVGSLHEGLIVSYYTASSRYWVGQVQSDANEVDGVTQVNVSPPPVQPHSEFSEVRLYKALGEFRLDGDVKSDIQKKTFRFKAAQVIS